MMKTSAPNCLQLLRRQIGQHHADQEADQRGDAERLRTGAVDARREFAPRKTPRVPRKTRRHRAPTRPSSVTICADDQACAAPCRRAWRRNERVEAGGAASAAGTETRCGIRLVHRPHVEFGRARRPHARHSTSAPAWSSTWMPERSQSSAGSAARRAHPRGEGSKAVLETRRFQAPTTCTRRTPSGLATSRRSAAAGRGRAQPR